MSNFSVVRLMDDFGRVTIPKDMREKFGMYPKDKVELEFTDKGILVKAYEEDEKTTRRK